MAGFFSEGRDDIRDAERRASLAAQGVEEVASYGQGDYTSTALRFQRIASERPGLADNRVVQRKTEERGPGQYQVVQRLLAGWDAPGVRTQPQMPQRRPQAPRPVGRSPNIVTGILSLLGQANTARRALIGG